TAARGDLRPRRIHAGTRGRAGSLSERLAVRSLALPANISRSPLAFLTRRWPRVTIFRSCPSRADRGCPYGADSAAAGIRGAGRGDFAAGIAGADRGDAG